MAMTKVKNLQLWCKKMAEGYRDVEVRDMAASWKSGLAFCAIIHRFRPDLIDYDSLSKENVFENNDLAFEVAEKQLSIPAFLEAADMVAIRVPDRLSVVTYVSQYYNYFHDKPQLGGPGVNKFNASSKKKENVVKQEDKSLTPVTTNGTPQFKKERQESIGDKCLICHERVYLLERHIENSKLYHRSCFRRSEMSPTSKVFKRQPCSPADEDKNDLHSNKFQKLNNGVPKEPTKPQDTGMDFWQRRAQKKAEQAVNSEKMDIDAHKDKKSEPKITSVGNSDKPEWQKELEKRPKSKLDVTPKTDAFSTRNNAAKDKKGESSSGGLMNKFKELNERNLKVLGANDTGSSSSNTKANVAANKRPPKFGTEVADKDISAKSGLSPVPKQRQNLQSKSEQMEIESSVSNVPKPVSRFKKTDEIQVPKASPRNINQKSKSPVETQKTDFIRPKSPQTQKAKMSLNLTKNVTETNTEQSIESPSSPPPLPVSLPPRLPKSDPPKQAHVPKFSMETSPVSSPRSSKPTKVDEASKPALSADSPPRKPPRTPVFQETITKPDPREKSSQFVEKSTCDSPMDTSEIHVAKAVIKGPDTGHNAVLVVPKRSQDENKNREVFGGLLKSLAGVRHKHDAVDEDKHDIGANEGNDKSNNKQVNGVKKGDERHEMKNKFDKVSNSSKSDWKSKGDKTGRPKSSFVSQSSSLFDNKDTNEANTKVSKVTKRTTTTTTVVTTNKNGKTKDLEKKVEQTVIHADDDTPEWKKQLELRKKEKARPKSADLLREKSESGKDIPLWKIEAEKRKDARKGGYVDPEKAKLNTNINSNNLQSSDVKTNRPLSPPQQKTDKSDKFTSAVKVDINKPKSPERPKVEIKIGKPVENVAENKKKKITVEAKFDFEGIDLKPANKRKPPRPAVSPLHSPTSPRPKPGPLRPPPPKTGTPQSPSHHLTAHQIQRQLKMIDERLTKLELKGRTLEDSIRKAEEEEEDNLMINWFELVNEKNELVRKECDVIYISREQELEMEQFQIDHRLRELVDKSNKTKEDEKEEEMLMEKLVEVVNQRSNIVDSIDEDRIRYKEEDSLIQAILQDRGFLKDSKDGGIKKDKTKK